MVESTAAPAAPFIENSTLSTPAATGILSTALPVEVSTVFAPVATGTITFSSADQTNSSVSATLAFSRISSAGTVTGGVLMPI